MLGKRWRETLNQWKSSKVASMLMQWVHGCTTGKEKETERQARRRVDKGRVGEVEASAAAMRRERVMAVAAVAMWLSAIHRVTAVNRENSLTVKRSVLVITGICNYGRFKAMNITNTQIDKKVRLSYIKKGGGGKGLSFLPLQEKKKYKSKYY